MTDWFRVHSTPLGFTITNRTKFRIWHESRLQFQMWCHALFSSVVQTPARKTQVSWRSSVPTPLYEVPWMFFLCLFATYWKELYLDLTKTLPYAALTCETLWTHRQTECTLSLSHTQSSYTLRMFDWTLIGNSWEVWETKDKPSEWKVKHDPMAIWTSPYLNPSFSDSEPESDSTTCSKPLAMEAHWLSDSLDILVLSATTWSLKLLNWADWFWNCTWRINWQAPFEPLEPLETWHLLYGKKLYGTFQIKLFGQSLPNGHKKHEGAGHGMARANLHSMDLWTC